MRGITKSSSTRSTVSLPSTSSASWPSPASSGLYERASRMDPTTLRIVGLSSTTRMRALIVSSGSVSPTTRPQSRTESGLGSAFADRADPELGELVRPHQPRSVTHQISALLRLRKGDHVTDALGASEQHGDAIHTERNPTVRRCAEAQRGQQEAELLFGFFVLDAECGENARLNFGVVQANRAAGDFEAVQHQIVAVALHFAGIFLDQIHMVVVRTSEGVVRGRPGLVLVVVREQRGFDDPQEIPHAAVADFRDQAE